MNQYLKLANKFRALNYIKFAQTLIKISEAYEEISSKQFSINNPMVIKDLTKQYAANSSTGQLAKALEVATSHFPGYDKSQDILNKMNVEIKNMVPGNLYRRYLNDSGQ